MNKKNLIILAIIGIAVIAIGGTIAYFQDVAKSEGNTFSTGNADLKIKSADLENCDTWEDSCTGKTWQNLYPGWADSYRVWLKNVSASPIVLKIVPFVEETGSSQDLWNNTFMEITWSDGSHSTGRYSLQWWKTNQTIELEPRLAQGEEAGPWIVKFDIPETVGNEIANSQIQFNLVFNGIQTGTGQISGCINDSDCNDQNVCTTDSCVNGQCIFSPNNNSCDDGNLCTENDTCSNGVCVGSSPIICNDDNVCTNDICDPATGCMYIPNNNFCNDGNACTINDTCSQGVCSGSPINCDDGNACTIDSCNPIFGCIHTFSPAGSPCDDGIFCNGIDSCNGNGFCANHSGDPCGSINDNDCLACNEATDSCTANEPAGSPCNDGLYCNGIDSCNGNGVCANHSGDPCPGPDGDTNCAESCNEATDSCTAWDPNGSACNGPGWYCSNGICLSPQ